MSVEERRRLIEPGRGELSIHRQCKLLDIHRSNYYYEPVKMYTVSSFFPLKYKTLAYQKDIPRFTLTDVIYMCKKINFYIDYYLFFVMLRKLYYQEDG